MTIFHHDHHEDSTDEWATPRQFVQPLAEAVGGFDLDPASGAEDSPHADEQFTEEDDGLAQDWYGNVWLNPPFSAKSEWLQKARDEYRNGDVELAAVLLPVDTSTQWFHDHVAEADTLWFKEGRLNFRGGGSSNRNPNFGIMLAVYGDAPRELLEVLENRGVVFNQAEKFASTQQTKLADGGCKVPREGDR